MGRPSLGPLTNHSISAGRLQCKPARDKDGPPAITKITQTTRSGERTLAVLKPLELHVDGGQVYNIPTGAFYAYTGEAEIPFTYSQEDRGKTVTWLKRLHNHTGGTATFILSDQYELHAEVDRLTKKIHSITQTNTHTRMKRTIGTLHVLQFPQ